MQKHREYVRKGVIISGLNQFAFLEEWGKPDHQGTWTVEGGQYQIKYGLRGIEVGGRHKAYNDVWIYYKQNNSKFRGFSNERNISEKIILDPSYHPFACCSEHERTLVQGENKRRH